jgi:hypothetical protein
MPNKVQLYYKLFDLYRNYLTLFPRTKLNELVWSRYGVSGVEEMSVQMLDDLIEFFKGVLSEEVA